MVSKEKIAFGVGPSKINMAYEEFGDPSDPPVLLIQGLGAQMVSWPEGFCSGLVDYGFRVVRFDNRDVGRSSRIENGPMPDLPGVLRGDLASVSYTLSDMAADSIGLLDALQIGSAHLVGLSMGGAIAQTAAIENPERVRSLTSMMSTTGDMKVGQASPETLKALFSGGPASTRQEVIDQYVKANLVIGSPGYPANREEIIERAERAYDRGGYDPIALARQGVASVASGDRTVLLQQLDLPVLVIHGLEDVMCDVSGGRATAAAIPGARLILIKGLGHNLPSELWPKLLGHISNIIRLGENRFRE